MNRRPELPQAADLPADLTETERVKLGDVAPLDDADFQLLSDLVYRRSGIQLLQHKRTMIRNRLSRRMRALGLKSFGAYIERLNAPNGKEPEFDRMLESICTHVTSFFREPAHFEYLSGPFLNERRQAAAVRILSAGCSTGEEPYSIAIALKDALPPGSTTRLQVQAVDLSETILKTAARGIYDLSKVTNLPKPVLHKHFLKGQKKYPDKVRVAPEIRHLVQFRKMNLIRPEKFETRFDAVFCRNVVIYFDRQAQMDTFRWFHDLLNPGGMLFLGHSESLIGTDHAFEYVQPTVYRRLG